MPLFGWLNRLAGDNTGKGEKVRRTEELFAQSDLSDQPNFAMVNDLYV